MTLHGNSILFMCTQKEVANEEGAKKENPTMTSPNSKTKPKMKVVRKPHGCHMCRKEFTSLMNLENHFFLHGGPEQCTICGLGFKSKKALKLHTPTHFGGEGNRELVCPNCPMKFRAKGPLINHIKKSHNFEEKPFVCSLCYNRYQSSSSLLTHKRVAHMPSNYRPPGLESIEGSDKIRASSNEQVPTEEPEILLSCPDCRKEFQDRATLIFHSWACQAQRSPINSIPLGGRSDSTNQQADETEPAIKTGKPALLECDVCENKFETNYQLVLHRAGPHFVTLDIIKSSEDFIMYSSSMSYKKLDIENRLPPYSTQGFTVNSL